MSKKLTSLSAATTIADADLAMIVADVSTTPVSKKTTWTTIKATILAWFEAQSVQTDTYSTVDADNGKVVVINKGSGVTVTIHSTAAAGFSCAFLQKGAGQITFAAGGTGAIRNRLTHTKAAGQYALCSIYVESNAGTAPQVYLGGDTVA